MNISNLTLADGQSTPVSQTFSAINPQQGSTPAKWLARNDGPYLSFSEITQLLARKNTSAKFSVKVRVPYLNDDGSFRAQNMFTCTFYIDDKCTAAERKDILAFARNTLLSTVVTSAVVDAEPTH